MKARARLGPVGTDAASVRILSKITEWRPGSTRYKAYQRHVEEVAQAPGVREADRRGRRVKPLRPRVSARQIVVLKTARNLARRTRAFGEVKFRGVVLAGRPVCHERSVSRSGRPDCSRAPEAEASGAVSTWSPEDAAAEQA